jgi:hypothetical protein
MDAMDLDIDMDVELIPDEPITARAQDTPVCRSTLLMAPSEGGRMLNPQFHSPQARLSISPPKLNPILPP